MSVFGKSFGSGLGLFLVARWTGFLGERVITIPAEDQTRSNSYGKNWFEVKRGLFWDEVVEYEEWVNGRAMRVGSKGWSCGKLKIKYER
jgi:hypothetical protein